MLKPQLPLEAKREEDVRKSLSESNGKLARPRRFLAPNLRCFQGRFVAC
jgi:hypothetical protein